MYVGEEEEEKIEYWSSLRGDPEQKIRIFIRNIKFGLLDLDLKLWFQVMLFL